MTWDGRIQADARLIPLADKTVQCCVTSPPYWGLRDYSVCSCVRVRIRTHESTGIAGSQIASAGSPDCVRCGGSGHDYTLASTQIGLERTPEAYVESLLSVFREVWRVLEDDGVLWVNIGDSYIGSGMTDGTSSKEGSDKREGRMFSGNRRDSVPRYKQKDLAGVPWSLAFALRSDGWYLRRDIIWSKPNPMPESVRDRCASAHEYIFMLSKQERYYYDAEAVAEAASWDGNSGNKNYRPSQGLIDAGMNSGGAKESRNKRSVWHIATRPYAEAHYATFPPEIPETCIKATSRPGDFVLDTFAGSNTTGMVAEKLGRRWVALDLGYQDLQAKRLKNVQYELVEIL